MNDGYKLGCAGCETCFYSGYESKEIAERQAVEWFGWTLYQGVRCCCVCGDFAGDAVYEDYKDWT